MSETDVAFSSDVRPKASAAAPVAAPANGHQAGDEPGESGEAGRSQRLNHSVERALTILSLFDAQHPHRGVNELARQLGLSRSAVSRLLGSLEAAGYVVQDPRNGRFRLGVRALELGYAFYQTSDLVGRAAPYLTDLSRQSQVHTHLHGLAQGRLFRYFTVPYPTGVGMLAGFSGFVHATSAGKVLLAHLPDDQVAAALRRTGLPPVTHRTITDPDRLRDELQAVRRQGWAIDDEESAVGMRCVAVPVRGAAGAVVAAAAVSTQRSRLPDERLPLIRDQLLEAAGHISAALGYETAPSPRGAKQRQGAASAAGG